MDKKVILVVDDEENIRILYREELVDCGYEVVLAENGEAALQKLSESKPDLIILDIKMPGMSGIELLKKIREDDKEIPVIMCTAYSDYKQDFNVWASDAYIVKSSDLQELKGTIEDILKKKSKKT